MTKTKITPITLEGILRVIGVKYIYPILFYILTSSLKKHTFYNLLINNILYLCVT